MQSNSFRLLVAFLLIAPCLYANATNSKSFPNQIGAVCYDPELLYHSVNSTSTLWQISDVVAIPTGVQSPDLWQSSSDFEQKILSAVQSPGDAASFAQACASIWKDYFSQQTDVFVLFSRTITKTDNILKCSSEVWTLDHTENSQDNDTSDWLKIGTFDVSQDSSESLLQTALGDLLNRLNSQPAVQTQPNGVSQ